MGEIVILFVLTVFFTVAANFFLMIYLFNKKEKEMLDNLIKYLESEEKKKVKKR